ncbi:MAG: DUF1080 domain-containing protein [Chloroflexi bacterium]|nr:DUF1080 domain-containing protein [Chloroflexota bacterium]
MNNTLLRRTLLGASVAAAILLASCSGGQPAVKYQPANASAPAQPLRWTFDQDPVGGLPPGAAVFSGSWAVRAEPGAPSSPNALCQTGTAEYPALTLGEAVYSDLVLAADFKPISGRTDRAGGLIFRVQDKDNYYILRANALENNVNFYRYAGGQRSLLKDGSASVPSEQWQELRVEVVGNHLRGFLNDEPVVETTDDTFTAGQVGLWTKADSTTCFDDVTVRTP